MTIKLKKSEFASLENFIKDYEGKLDEERRGTIFVSHGPNLEICIAALDKLAERLDLDVQIGFEYGVRIFGIGFTSFVVKPNVIKRVQ